MIFSILSTLLLACGAPAPPPMTWNGVELDIGQGVVTSQKSDVLSIEHPTLAEESVVRGAYGDLHDQLVAGGWKELRKGPGFGAFRLADGRGARGVGFVMAGKGIVSVRVLPNPGLSEPWSALGLDLSHAVAFSDPDEAVIDYFARPASDAERLLTAIDAALK